MTEDRIPAVEIYRGVRVHDAQSQERIDRAVKPAIDRVLAMASAGELVAVVGNRSWPPEARLAAAAVIEAMFEASIAQRLERPKVDHDYVIACVAGLDSGKWRNPAYYECLLDGCRGPDSPRAAERPAQFREQVERDE